MNESKTESQSKVVLAGPRLLCGVSWADCHGRKVKTAWLQNGEQVTSVDADVVCVVDCRGDRDEIWLVVKRDDIEIARHNTRYIESIEWESPNGAGELRLPGKET